MKTTIVIAVRNGENYLFETLSQLIGIPCRVLISDNHSTDNTAAIISHFPNFERVMPPTPMTMLEHWSWASSKVQTPYMRLVGHDDLVNPLNIVEHESFLDSHHEYSSVRSYREIFFSSKFSKVHTLFPKHAGSEIVDSFSLLRSVSRMGTNAGGEPFTTTVRMSSFRKINARWGGDEFGMCELNTWMELARIGHTGWVNTSAGKFRVHTISYSSSLGNPIKQARLVRKWILSQPEFVYLPRHERIKSWFTTKLRALARSGFYLTLKLIS